MYIETADKIGTVVVKLVNHFKMIDGKVVHTYLKSYYVDDDEYTDNIADAKLFDTITEAKTERSRLMGKLRPYQNDIEYLTAPLPRRRILT